MLSKHLSRASTSWDQKVLVLVDSLVALGAVRKMRSSSISLLRQLLPIGMAALTLGVRLEPRWIRSRFNPADGPSRGQPVGPAPETADKDDDDDDDDDDSDSERDDLAQWLQPWFAALEARYSPTAHL